MKFIVASAAKLANEFDYGELGWIVTSERLVEKFA
jgi:hypothetical protein